MKERPILFSAPMVRAILEGQKTQTRRIVKSNHIKNMAHSLGKGTWLFTWNPFSTSDSNAVVCQCPHGQPGDRLWVRETFMCLDNRDGGRKILYKADAGEKVVRPGRGDDDWRGDSKWRPSIFMLREYSRITLEITNVRVERVQDISEADAESEGVAEYAKSSCSRDPDDALDPTSYFELLWSTINGRASWDNNPFVWVLEFKRILRAR